MIDRFDEIRRNYSQSFRKQNRASMRALAEYKRISGDVTTVEQIYLDDRNSEKVPSTSKIENYPEERIGTKINIRV